MSSSGSRSATRGNVLLITVDQWRGDCLSVSGHPVVETPALDRLAASGTLFANHWAQAAPCGPSRACLYTGTYLLTNRVGAERHPARPPVHEHRARGASRWLRPRAVRLHRLERRPPRDRARRSAPFSYEGVLPGFDAVVDFPFADRCSPWIDWLVEQGYERPARPARHLPRRHRVPGGGRPRADMGATRLPRPSTARPPTSPTSCCGGSPRTGGRPWFVHASYLRPHPPYRVVAPYHDRYDPADVPEPVRAADPRARGGGAPAGERGARACPVSARRSTTTSCARRKPPTTG